MSEVEYTPPAFGVSDGTVNGDLTVGGNVELGSGGPTITTGTGNPETAVTAPVGSIFIRTDGGAGRQHYQKYTGTGDTGWLPVPVWGSSAASRVPWFSASGVLNSSSTFTFDGTDFVTPNVNLGSGGPTITTGTGVPSATGPSGSIYLRDDGAGGTVLYVKGDDSPGTTWRYGLVSVGTTAFTLGQIPWSDSSSRFSGTAGFTFDGSTFTTPNVELGSGGPTITTGTAVPSASEPQGSKYIRDTTLGDHEYVATDDAGTWQVTGAADTGWRLMGEWDAAGSFTGSLPATGFQSGWTYSGAGFWKMRRVGDTVTHWVNGLKTAASGTGGQLFTLSETLSAGFQWEDWLYEPVKVGGTTGWVGTAGSKTYLDGAHSATSTNVSRFKVQSRTAGAWPTSLPGSAA